MPDIGGTLRRLLSAGGACGPSGPIKNLRDIADKRERAQNALSVMDDRFTALMGTDPPQVQIVINKRINTGAAYMSSSKNLQNHP